jgi:hypothetical protein
VGALSRRIGIASAVLAGTAAVASGVRADVEMLTRAEALDRFVDHLDRRVPNACAQLARDKHTFGDVRVTLRKGPLGPSSISIEPEPELDAEVVACVDRVVREAARHELGDDGVDHGTKTVFIVGEPTAVLPPIEQLLDDWRRAGAEPSARRALQHRLTRGITVSDQGCLRVPGRLSLRQGLQPWLRQLGPRIFDVAFADAVTLFTDIGPVRPVGGDGFTPNHRWRDGAFIDDETVLLRWMSQDWYPKYVAPSELCLVPLTAHVREELGQRLDGFSRCLVGDLRQRFTHPRISFPDDRHYRAVGAGHGLHSCAVDERGQVDCCGRRTTPAAPPGETFAAVTPGQMYDCGLLANGALRCWGNAAPVPGVVRGPFAQVAVDGRNVCAVAAADRAVTCWGAGVGGDAERAVGAVERVRVDNRGVCALRVGGELLCWSTYSGDQRIVKVPGRWKAFDMNAGYACGVDAGNGAIACWQRDPSPPPGQEGRRQPVGGGGYVDVAVGYKYGRGCGLDGGGGVHCWPAEVRPAFAGARFRAVSGGGLICGVTVEGRVICEDREYY